jgi:hypothetical protein
MMNQEAEQLLVQSLIDRSRSQRSLVMLAMAFKAHRPDWGSQGTLVALGLTEFLNYIGWHLDLTEIRLPSWIEDAEERMDDQMLNVRLNQIQRLVDLVKHPRPVVLARDPKHHQVTIAQLFCDLANAGVMARDLRGLNELDGTEAREELERVGIDLSESLALQLESRWDQLRGLTVEHFVNALSKHDRDFHPSVLWFQVTRHLETIGCVLSTMSTGDEGLRA